MYENENMKPAETPSGMVEGGVKDNDEGNEFSYDIYKHFWKCNMYPQYNNNKNNKIKFIFKK
jgi:hypothetical protein